MRTVTEAYTAKEPMAGMTVRVPEAKASTLVTEVMVMLIPACSIKLAKRSSRGMEAELSDFTLSRVFTNTSISGEGTHPIVWGVSNSIPLI